MYCVTFSNLFDVDHKLKTTEPVEVGGLLILQAVFVDISYSWDLIRMWESKGPEFCQFIK